MRGVAGVGKVLCTVAVLLLGGASPGHAQGVAESQKRLQEIRSERSDLRKDLTRLRSQVHNVTGELQNLQQQMVVSEQAVRELDFQVGATGAAIELTTRDLLNTQDRLAEKRALLQRRLRDLYKRGPLATARVLLASESFADLLNRYKYLALVARHDRKLVGEVDALQKQLEVRGRQLRRTLADVQGLQQERVREKVSMQSLEAEQKRSLSALRVQARTTAERIDQLARDEKRLAGLLATLERKRREEAARARTTAAKGSSRTTGKKTESSTLSTADLGSLGWPVEGQVIYRFGRATQPNGGTIRWNGIGIAAPAGTPVRSVEAGTVVLAAPFEGYGPTVVLSHGGGYYSLYLYLKQLAVKEGDSVARGQTLGTVGGGATPEGAHLEFQIRSPGGQAVDPLDWLRNRGAR